MKTNHLTLARSTARRSRESLLKVTLPVERSKVSHSDRTVINRSNERSPNVTDPGNAGTTEDTLSGFFSKMQADTPDTRPISLINVDLLPTTELSLFFKLDKGERELNLPEMGKSV